MERLVNIILRALQLIFAIIVAGITGNYLVRASGISNWHLGRLIYTEVIAALSIVVALVWMIPFPGSSFIKWPMDIVLAIGWFISFGLLVNRIGRNCGYILNWYYGGFRNTCSRFRADVAFAFLSAIAWLASVVLAMFWLHRRRRNPTSSSAAPPVAASTTAAAAAGAPDTRVESQPLGPTDQGVGVAPGVQQPVGYQPGVAQPGVQHPGGYQPGVVQPGVQQQQQPPPMAGQPMGQPEMRAVQ